MKTAAKVFIIIGMVVQFYFIYPIIVGAIALSKLNKATSREELVGIGVVTLLFCNLIGGILMLTIKDEHLNVSSEEVNVSSDTQVMSETIQEEFKNSQI